MMYAEIAWVLVSPETQVQPRVILDPVYLPDYLSVSYDYSFKNGIIPKNFFAFVGVFLSCSPELLQNIEEFGPKDISQTIKQQMQFSDLLL